MSIINAMRIAAIQMVSTDCLVDNLRQAETLIDRAAKAQAQLVLLPENFAFIGRRERDKLALAESEGAGPIQEFLAGQARAAKLWLAGGSVPLTAAEPERAYSSCLLYAPDGTLHARYDKIHLFDVSLDDEQRETYRESDATVPGRKITVAETPLARVGLSICYDLRFPEMYRNMHKQGVQLLLVPSAFTRQTGQAHWELLLRARAVENLCYVLAANQGGSHATGRATYGHSMVVDPWGTVLARAASGPDVVYADVEKEKLQRLRQRFPAIAHRRLGCPPP